TMFQAINIYADSMIPTVDNKAYILDILKKLEAYYYKAHHHPLTHLPNKELFADRLMQSIRKSQRNKFSFLLLYIDIDNFKRINDSFGHTIGDKVLIEIGNRLNSSTRKVDTVAHLHGDEFAIILENIKHTHDAKILIEKFLNIIRLPIHVDGHTIESSISIGVSQYPLDSSNPHTLFKYADLAMYQSKIKGNNTFTYYNKTFKINT
ncbi:MAG: GGDEF domain-containing protein, partial [Campylobacterota bacterium]|nr:GGDEF domain-containing protein [Campylobacterota bacterium]